MRFVSLSFCTVLALACDIGEDRLVIVRSPQASNANSGVDETAELGAAEPGAANQAESACSAPETSGEACSAPGQPPGNAAASMNGAAPNGEAASAAPGASPAGDGRPGGSADRDDGGGSPSGSGMNGSGMNGSGMNGSGMNGSGSEGDGSDADDNSNGGDDGYAGSTAEAGSSGLGGRDEGGGEGGSASQNGGSGGNGAGGSGSEAGLLPDLILDQAYLQATIQQDFVDASADLCLFNEGCVTGDGLRRVIRFGTRSANVGTADVVVGEPVADNPLWEFDACHEHFHFEGFARYDLIDASTGQVLPIGNKNGFCLQDLDSWDGTACGTYDCEFQGISVGCADVYTPDLDCQWVDITDVTPGTYELLVTVNTDGTIQELSTVNNSASVTLEIEAEAVRIVLR